MKGKEKGREGKEREIEARTAVCYTYVPSLSVEMYYMFVCPMFQAVSGWGVSLVREGLERKNLARFDSYSVQVSII